MARGQGSEKSRAHSREQGEPADAEAAGSLTSVPEIMRKLLSVGFSGFFMTESAVRRALGDALPRDWVDFAVEQSERTRAEFLERLSHEIARSLENLDVASVLAEFLEGRTVEIHAQIRLGPRDGEASEPRLDLVVERRRDGH